MDDGWMTDRSADRESVSEVVKAYEKTAIYERVLERVMTRVGRRQAVGRMLTGQIPGIHLYSVLRVIGYVVQMIRHRACGTK